MSPATPLISPAVIAAAIRDAATRPIAGDLPLEACTTDQASATDIFTVPSASGDVHVTVQAPQVFARLRDFEGLDASTFENAWIAAGAGELEVVPSPAGQTYHLRGGPGQLAKLISPLEASTVQSYLLSYYAVIHARPSSLLQRLLMLLKIEVAGAAPQWVIVVADPLAHAEYLNECWTLKGRQPKPGQYRFFPTSNQFGSSAASSGSNADGRAREPHSPHPEAAGHVLLGNGVAAANPPAPAALALLSAKRDVDLDRCFWVETDAHQAVLENLTLDLAFLEQQGLFGYSLLIGVRFNKDGKTSPTADPVFSQTHQVNSRFHLGMPSILGEETYFVSLVDTMTVHDGTAKKNSFLKSLLWRAASVAEAAPLDYKSRLAEYSQLIFACPHDSDNAIDDTQ